ncbi:polysaccharide biosynthesis protein [Mariniflexile maritimum]|uniref:polysaccharide biosynthesis protein n=1 Tax=Mariniflexile maritimum TaxID=2682493 RepID=UPI0012F69340|nr:polysaccharide biosynthesis protein [Mariniflexile maritimum]
MEPATYKHIKQLMVSSGLIPHYQQPLINYEAFNFETETIVITGAAGTIGSELAKQLLVCNYRKLILVDCAESPLYNLIKEFEKEEVTSLEYVLSNINDADVMTGFFEVYKPTLIFHAAAYKHVPLMEMHPYEAVKTNYLATQHLADLAIKHDVKKFVFISTDKAVNPESVMGITKHLAERYIMQLQPQESTQFSIARFGNIMGSNGSVLPLFINQIASGHPLSITHERITRYFMDKHKACALIVQIALFKMNENSLFTFDMGTPIKLMDVVQTLISMYAEKNKNQTIDLKITGLRPGEKFEEELVSKDEILTPTQHNAIFLVSSREPKTQKKPVNFTILKNITPYQTPQEIKAILKSLI